MSDFLPPSYEIPASGGRYLKLQQGENRFRVLASPVVGNEFWTEVDKKRKPVRRRMGDPITADESGGSVKHFWAMPVYANGSVQILEITQKGLQKAIKELAADEDWGNPREYDLAIFRQGEGMETEYSVVPKPKRELSAEAKKAWADTLKDGFDLEALFSDEDPFSGTPAQDTSVDGVPFPDNE